MILTATGLSKLLWMVIVINGDVAGVFLNEPMPDYMTLAECEEAAAQHGRDPINVAQGITYRCVMEYGRPLTTGKYWRRLE